MPDYKQIAKEARLKILDLIYKAGTSHIGSNYSAVDIFTVLFSKIDPNKDEAVLSAGWKAAGWYYFLWKLGIISEEELNSFCMPDSKFIGLIEPMGRWSLRIAGGSMGLGLPAAIGLALAKKIKNESGQVYCFMSDGEMDCGTTWESALIAPHHNLDNLTVIVDNNGWQAMGKTDHVLNLDHCNLVYKWQSFGWDTIEINGHDFNAIENAITSFKYNPTIVIAHTVKGKGVSFMEDENLWHYAQIKEDDYEKARKDLNA